MSRRDNWEPEDGMGFAGLVPTAAEKREERERERTEQRLAAHADLLYALKLARQYLAHPEVKAITEQMAVRGSVVLARIDAAITKAEAR